MEMNKPEIVVLVLLSIILILGGYIIIAGYSSSKNDLYQKGCNDCEMRLKNQVVQDLINNGFTEQEFIVNGQRVTTRLYEAPTQEQLQKTIQDGQIAAYQQGFMEGRTNVATNMLQQLNQQGFIVYNFTDGKQLATIKLAPVAE